MIIETKKLKDLKPAPYNPRKSTERQEGNLKASLQRFGCVEPIIFNKQTGYIVGGHFRVRELKKLGFKEVECVIVDLNEADEKELNIRLNANTGEWDMDLLDTNFESEDLENWGLDLPNFESEDVQDYSNKNKEINTGDFSDKMTIKLEFVEEEYHQVKAAFENIGGTPESIIWNLLGLNETAF